MASLRETKDRIGSVRSTLKITSAMKLVASAKLRKAQKAIEGMRPYERTLAEILSAIGPVRPAAASDGSAANYFSCSSSKNQFAASHATPTHAAAGDAGMTDVPPFAGKTAIVAIASNSSLCGAFNANVIRKALETARSCEGEVELYPVGRKMVEALRRAGYDVPGDFNELVAHPSYEQSAALARSLSDRFLAGEISRVVLVYTRFISSARQEPVAEQYLPFVDTAGDGSSEAKSASADRPTPGIWPEDKYGKGVMAARGSGDMPPYIIEPDAESLLATLMPQVLMLKFHAAVLDSSAAEHAARTIAMQTASDNAEELLGELTLEYNKGRQQKITAEILDLLGGAAQ